MTAQFLILGIMLILLIFLLLWFVPSHLYRYARKIAKVSEEITELRNLVLDLLNAQELVSRRQQHLANSVMALQKNSEVSQYPIGISGLEDIHSIEKRITELQDQINSALNARDLAEQASIVQDSESWGYLLSLLSHMQERMGLLAHAQHTSVNQNNEQLADTLKQELQQLQILSENIVSLHQRLQDSLVALDQPIQKRRSRITTPLEVIPIRHN